MRSLRYVSNDIPMRTAEGDVLPLHAGLNGSLLQDGREPTQDPQKEGRSILGPPPLCSRDMSLDCTHFNQPAIGDMRQPTDKQTSAQHHAEVLF